MEPPTLTYHSVPIGDTRYSYEVSKILLRQHLAALKSLGQVALTFDDGDISQAATAPAVIAEYGFKATFFITLGWTGVRTGYMGWDDIRRLRDSGHRIGLHGWSHSLLTTCRKDSLKDELERPREVLRK
jgi:peptidoglycan/xylan/chitin deacetylase (PgdA/CDA1 family)